MNGSFQSLTLLHYMTEETNEKINIFLCGEFRS